MTWPNTVTLKISTDPPTIPERGKELAGSLRRNVREVCPLRKV